MRLFPVVNLLVLFAFVGGSASAHADVITEDVAQCRSKNAGDACMDGKGACVTSRCARLDYSKGTPPRGTIQYDCMRCTPGAKPTGVAADVKKSHSCATAPGTGPLGMAMALLLIAATLLTARALRHRTQRADRGTRRS